MPLDVFGMSMIRPLRANLCTISCAAFVDLNPK
jgi:hypothetical protein